MPSLVTVPSAPLVLRVSESTEFFSTSVFQSGFPARACLATFCASFSFLSWMCASVTVAGWRNSDEWAS
jgi:hypothetical protein